MFLPCMLKRLAELAGGTLPFSRSHSGIEDVRDYNRERYSEIVYRINYFDSNPVTPANPL